MFTGTANMRLLMNVYKCCTIFLILFSHLYSQKHEKVFVERICTLVRTSTNTNTNNSLIVSEFPKMKQSNFQQWEKCTLVPCRETSKYDTVTNSLIINRTIKTLWSRQNLNFQHWEKCWLKECVHWYLGPALGLHKQPKYNLSPTHLLEWLASGSSYDINYLDVTAKKQMTFLEYQKIELFHGWRKYFSIPDLML